MRGKFQPTAAGHATEDKLYAVATPVNRFGDGVAQRPDESTLVKA
jgi:hypothetical protein